MKIITEKITIGEKIKIMKISNETNYQHKNLAAGKWKELSFLEQIIWKSKKVHI